MARHLPGTSCIAGLLMLAGCGLSGPAYEPAPEDAAVVDMTTWLSFDPSTIEITAGDTIEWRNTSPFTHTVTFTSAEAGTAAVDSGPIGPGEVFRHSFLTAGAYRYVCKPHEGHDMRGTVIVQPKAS